MRVVLKSKRHTHVNTRSYLRHVPAPNNCESIPHTGVITCLIDENFKRFNLIKSSLFAKCYLVTVDKWYYLERQEDTLDERCSIE